MDVSLTKYGHENSYFSREIGKNGILLTLRAHNIVYFWQNWCFLTEHGHDSGMFIMNTFWKKDMRALFFERMDVFWQNVGMRAVCFLENERDAFLTKYRHESSSFFEKNRLGKEEGRAKSFIKISAVKLLSQNHPIRFVR